ncbi:MAG: Tyrosine-protein kinase Wzc [Frankiales bacterium]|nr:Tyrosine-protein kinase Wzc [Frankiales bacterium]
MDIGALLGLLRRRAFAILLCVLVGIGGGYALLRSSPNVYQSQSEVFISLPGTSTPAEALQGLQISSQLLQSYADIVSSRTLAEKVKLRLSLPESVDQVRSKLSAAPKPQTLYIVIKGHDNDPVRARSITEAATSELIASISDLEKGRDKASAVQASVLDAPVRGTKISPRPSRDLSLAGIVGLLVGLGLALALDGLDRTVKTAAQAHQLLDTPVLGAVPRLGRKRAVVMAPAGNDPVSEAYRSLRTAVRFVNPDHPVRCFAVTSPAEGDGKTTTAANLAVALAESGQRVVLIDADMRRAGLAPMLGIEGAVGLSNVVVGQVDVDEAMQPWRDLLMVLPAGTLPPNPSELLGSQSMADLLDLLIGRFDMVVLDAPPALPVTDAVVLSTLVDGLVVVVRAGKTSRPVLSELRRRLETVQAHVLGLVLNGAPAAQQDYYDYRPQAAKTR